MKIKLKYYDSWGELKECILQVSSQGTVQDLQFEIYKVTGIELDDQQVFIIKNGKQIQITNQEQYLSSIQFDKHSILFVQQTTDRFSINSTIRKQPESFGELSTSEIFKSIHNSQIHTQSNSKMNQEIGLHLEQFFDFIQRNYFDETYDFLQRNSHIKDELINDTTTVGWSALHVSVIVGSEKIFLLLLNEGGNINQNTRDGWDCLSLAACLKQKTILCLLLGQKELNINKQTKHGTVLHLIAQNDDLEIAQILLKHPKIDLNALNRMKQTPIDIAGPLVRNFLRQEINQKQIQFHRKSFISSMSGISVDNLSKDSFIINKPNRPPILTGKVFKVNYLRLRMYERYMIADPDSGTIARFKNKLDVPQNPNEVIPIESIDDVKVSEEEWFMEENFYYIEIKFFKKHIYIALSEKNAARRWFEGLKNCVGYVRYINQHLNKWNSIEDQKFAKRAFSLMMQKPNIVMNIPDSRAVDQKTHIESQIQAKRDKYKQGLKSISEAEFDVDVVEEKISQKASNYLGISNFQVFELIGKGSFGNVYRAKFKNLECALKQQEKDRLIRDDFLKYTISELQILKTINHPFIVRFYMSFQTQFYLYLATELCPAGDLARYMTRGVILSEFTAKFIIAQIILAIEYLHLKKIIYRDLKPENILISKDGYIKLTDFGLCKQGGAVDIIATSFCGSPAYLPPELIAGNGSTKATDIYQIGTILYEMLTGYPPFYCQDMRTLLDNIRYQQLKMPKNISQSAADLLKRVLNKDPEERLGYQDVSILKKHIFFAEIDWDKLLARKYKPPQLQMRNNANFARNGFKMNETQNKILDLDYQEGQERLNYIDNWDFSQI